MTDAFDVAGKVVLITGAGRGIGRGIAEVLAEAGADVALNALTSEFVEPAAREIAGGTGRKVVAFPANMADVDAAQAAVDAVLDEFGHVDVLVNGVGDAIRQTFSELTPTQLEAQLDVNFRATAIASRAVGPHFIERHAGKVINISSSSATRGGAQLAVYAAAKAGVESLTRALALEWAPYGITVNCIAPGMFPDPRRPQPEAAPELIEQMVARIPCGRVGDVREVGYLVRYLASPASDYMTGAVLRLDGGSSL